MYEHSFYVQSMMGAKLRRRLLYLVGFITIMLVYAYLPYVMLVVLLPRRRRCATRRMA